MRRNLDPANFRNHWLAKWGNPYTEPPDGKPRILLEMTTPYTERAIPKEIEALTPPGSGWAVFYYRECLIPPRRLSEETKLKIRRKRHEARVRKAAPLFADQILKEEADVVREP